MIKRKTKLTALISYCETHLPNLIKSYLVPPSTLKRSISGILLLDKPLYASSNKVLQQIKRLYQAQKAGHTGSLDPMASGMMAICLGEATKISQYLLSDDKAYLVEMTLGETRTTGDSEGAVLDKLETVPNFSQEQIQAALSSQTGTIEQTPPMYSALKHQGRPLYYYARQGIEIKRPARNVTIHDIKLLEHQGNKLTLEVLCSKGTYIRSLSEDIGKFLGVGAYVSQLCRLWQSPFESMPMNDFNAIEKLSLNKLDALLLPIDKALPNLPGLSLNDQEALKFKQGQSLECIENENELLRVYNAQSLLIGIGEVEGTKLKCKRYIHPN